MKNILALNTLLLLCTPFFFAEAQTVQQLTQNTGNFLGTSVLIFLLGIAFLIFVINAVRYFVLGGTNEQDREKAKMLAIYSVFAFVLIIIFFGVVNLIASSIGLKDTQPYSDYECPGGLCPESMEPDWLPPADNPCDDPYNPMCNPGAV